MAFDLIGDRLDLEIQAFHEPRVVRVAADGVQAGEVEVATSWTPVAVDLAGSAGVHRVTLAIDECVSPSSLGVGDDSRCLSFQVRGLPLRRLELFDLTNDPLATTDLGTERPDLRDRMVEGLRRYRMEPVAPPEQLEVPAELLDTLRALGYVD